MRIVFMGTPQFAAYTLEQLLKTKHEIVAVVTAPDKPAGRGLKLKSSEVKQIALMHQIPIFQPEKLKNPDFIKSLKDLNADLFVVVAFRMLPKEVWSIPSKGTINIHASLLPQYRGAAPINWVLINGEKTTGVTIFFINENIDTGDIIAFKEINILPDYNAGLLHDILMKEGTSLLIEQLENIENNNIKTIPQDAFRISGEPLKIAPKITPEICRINWDKKIECIHNLIRGLSPTPGAFTYLINNKTQQRLMFKIYSSEIVEGKHQSPTGIIIVDKKNMYITADGGLLNIVECQLEGKRKMNSVDFLNGMQNIEDWKVEK